MTARLPWHPPKVRVLGQQIRAGPHLSCLVDLDGRIIVRGIPIVTRTTRTFDAYRLISVIVGVVEFRSFTSADLGELAYHSEELRLAIGDMSTRELGMALRSMSIEGEAFGGYRIQNDGRDADGTIWRIYPV